MERANKLVKKMEDESENEDSEDETRYTTGKKLATTKQPKNRKVTGRTKPDSTVDLPRTINEYGINMDKARLRTITLDPQNILFNKYTKDQTKPKPYHKADRWDRPLARAPGGRSFEADANKFLSLIRKEIAEDITRSEMEEKVLEVGRPAGMLASTIEGIWAKKFIVDTSVSHPIDLLVESWQEDGRMREHNPTRLFWVISHLTGNQWTRRNPIYLPHIPDPGPPPQDQSGTSWAQAVSSTGMAERPRASVRLDDSALKRKLRQVKITGAKTKHVKYYSVTLSIPKATDPAMKFSEIATDLVKNLYGIDDNLAIYPYQTKNHAKKKAIPTCEQLFCLLLLTFWAWRSCFSRLLALQRRLWW